MAETGAIAALLAHSPLTAIVGTDGIVGSGHDTASLSLPYVVVTRTDTDYETTFEDQSTERAALRVQIFANRTATGGPYDNALAISAVVKAAIQAGGAFQGALLENEFDLESADEGVARRVLDFEFYE